MSCVIVNFEAIAVFGHLGLASECKSGNISQACRKMTGRSFEHVGGRRGSQRDRANLGSFFSASFSS